ncbi:MAG: shikimate kinase [Megasphaera sp.]|nr:shikimate kinase [Megasphaera sp.]MCI1248529.1 shikimate kinase [Megasphaera sp.]
MGKQSNIILIGMPGSGKSTFGKALAEKLGRTFIDADDFLVMQEGKTIPELFAVSEDCFRDAETRTAKTLAEQENIIIACGGGVVKRPVNIEIYKKTGHIIFVDRSPERIANDIEIGTRPLLKNGAKKLYELYHERIQAYRTAADYIVANDRPESEVLDELVHLAGKL